MRIGCKRCYERTGRFEPATQFRLPNGRWSEAMCDSCHDDAAQDAFEAFLADFHGGVAPQAVYDATYRRG